MDGGVVMEQHAGTPQGGPLSPILANVLLDEVDPELERRGHLLPPPKEGTSATSPLSNPSKTARIFNIHSPKTI